MKILRYIGVLAYICIMTSCDQMVTNVEIPESESHIVMQGFLSPEDSLVSITVSKSIPVFGSEGKDSSYLSGVMKINDYVIPRKVGTKKFEISQSDFPILSGQTYTITYQTPDGVMLKGECTVPATVNTQLQFLGYDSTDMVDWVEYYAKYEFTDLPEANNYYRMTLKEISYSPDSSDTSAFYITRPEDFFTDNNSGGNRNSGRFNVSSIETYNGIADRYLILYTCDSHYFYYHQAVIKQSESGNGPFSEPVVVPSNIENGLGCIGAYRKYVIHIN